METWLTHEADSHLLINAHPALLKLSDSLNSDVYLTLGSLDVTLDYNCTVYKKQANLVFGISCAGFQLHNPLKRIPTAATRLFIQHGCLQGSIILLG